VEQMPEYKEGYITLWRDGKFVQVALENMPKIIEEDSRGITKEAELPVGA